MSCRAAPSVPLRAVPRLAQVSDTSIEFTIGRRYGLLGSNGSGKSTFLKCLAAREVPIPDHIDIFLLENEAPATNVRHE